MYKVTQWVPRDRSGTVCWLLHELGVPFEIQELDYKKDHDDPAYRKIHPLGKVPALTDLRSGMTMIESGAICLFLADRHSDQNLFPASQKAAIYQWILYNYATIDAEVEHLWKSLGQKDEAETAKADHQLAELLKPIEATLNNSEYICGDQFTVADVPLGQTLSWFKKRPMFTSFPKSQAYLERLMNRDAAKKAGLFLAEV